MLNIHSSLLHLIHAMEPNSGQRQCSYTPAPLLFRHEQGALTTSCKVWKKQLDSLEPVEVVFALTEEYLYLYVYMTCTEVKIL